MKVKRVGHVSRAERRAAIVDEARAGVPVSDLSRKYGYTPQYVRFLASNCGVALANKAEARRVFAREEHARGKTTGEIAQSLGCSERVVWCHLTRDGLVPLVAKPLRGRKLLLRILARLIGTDLAPQRIADEFCVSRQYVDQVRDEAVGAGIPLHPSRLRLGAAVGAG